MYIHTLSHTYAHTNTHTHTRAYIYRERERDRESALIEKLLISRTTKHTGAGDVEEPILAPRPTCDRWLSSWWIGR